MGIDIVQRTLDGLLDGASYALVGLGLTLTFGTLRRLNLAHGAVAMLGAYAGAWLFARLEAPAWAVAFAVVLVAGLAGLYVEWLCFGRTDDGVPVARGGGPVAGADAREVVALAASFAVWMQLEQLAVNLLPRHLNAFPSLAATSEWSLGALVMRADRLALALVAIALCSGVGRWLARSRTGLAWRAVADQRVAAHLVGIAVPRVQRAAFAAASALAGAAAFAVLALDGQVTPMVGMWVLAKGLLAALLGGLGSVRGVLAGGLLLGLVEAHAQAAFGASGREAAGWALVLLMLLAPWARLPRWSAHGG